MIAFMTRTANRVVEVLTVAEDAGDILYFSAPGVIVAAGRTANPLPSLHSLVIGVPPGGSLSDDGDLATVDSGLSIDLYLHDNYAGGAKRILDELTGLGGDLGGTLVKAKVVQADCPDSENWPTADSKITFEVNEADDVLRINVQYSDGTRKSASLPLSDQ
jgi:hypothetical protein